MQSKDPKWNVLLFFLTIRYSLLQFNFKVQSPLKLPCETNIDYPLKMHSYNWLNDGCVMSSSKYFKHIWDDTISTIYEKHTNKKEEWKGDLRQRLFIIPGRVWRVWVGTTVKFVNIPQKHIHTKLSIWSM